MTEKKQHRHLLIYLFIIAAISLGDHKFTPHTTNTGTGMRYAIHLAALILIGITGLVAWKKNLYPWQRSLWLLVYAVVTSFIVCAGVANYFMPLGEKAKDAITVVRVGFANPLPFMVLCVLTVSPRLLKGNT